MVRAVHLDAGLCHFCIAVRGSKKRQRWKLKTRERRVDGRAKTYGDEGSLAVIDCLDLGDMAGVLLAESRLRR